MNTEISAKGDNSIWLAVVTTPEQFMQAMAIRAICFLEQPGMVYNGTIDGNDYQATHILAYDDVEPIGATRIRWFKDFAKIERTAFRPNYRSPRILKRCSDFIFNHVSMKGYDKLITHANPTFARVWKAVLGFEQISSRPRIISNNQETFVELIKYLEPSKYAVSLESQPQTLFRIEGHWDKAHPLEAQHG